MFEDFEGQRIVMDSFEIKIKIASSAFGNTIQFSLAEVVRGTFSDDFLKKHVPLDHMPQVILHSVVMRVDFSFHAVAAETCSFYTVMLRVIPGIRSII